MLIKFTVENFLSFMDKAVLNLEAGSIREYNKNAFTTKLGTQDIRLLKSVFMFGGNAAGKSNFLKAFLAMKLMVIHSGRDQQLGVSGSIVPFLLNRKTHQAPSTFEAIFLVGRVAYRYGFTADSSRVHLEWLYVTYKRKEELVFIRTDQQIDIDKRFQQELKQKLAFLTGVTRPDSLYISVLHHFNVDFADVILKWFRRNTVYMDDLLDEGPVENTVSYTAGLLKLPEYKRIIYSILEKADLGFYSIEEELREHLAKRPNSPLLMTALYGEGSGKHTIKTKHAVYNENLQPVDDVYFDLLKQESSGTRKFLEVIGPIVTAMVEGRVMWLDELDARLHILLMQLIVKLFHNSPFNINGAQFIVTTHNSHVLKKLRRDQMIMLNKDKYGASTIGSVYHSKPGVRSDAIFDKEYLLGTLGGIPKGEQLSLFDQGDEE